MAEQIQLSVKKGVATITINRPEKKNALTQAMYAELTDKLQQCLHSDQVQSCILTGRSGNFTAGNDLADFMHADSKDLAPVLAFIKSLPYFSKPLIAAVEGVAIGIGTTLMLHCDFAYADEAAVFQTPFTALGVCPEAGASLLMPAQIGAKSSSRLLLASEKISGTEAARINLITQATNQNVLELATEKALQLAHYPQHAIQTTKKLSQFSPQEVENMMQTEAEHFFACLKHPVTQQHIANFFKREAQ